MDKTIANILVFFFISTGVVIAEDSRGYNPIREIKVWDRNIGVFLDGKSLHTCRAVTANKSVFALDIQSPNGEQKYSLIMAAFLSGKPVQFMYKCGADNNPYIRHVRVRN